MKSDGSDIAASKSTATPTAINVAACKVACEARGVECYVYFFNTNGNECIIYNIGADEVKSNGKSDEGKCYDDAHSHSGMCVQSPSGTALTDRYNNSPYVTVPHLVRGFTLSECKSKCLEEPQFCSAYEFDAADGKCLLLDSGKTPLKGKASVPYTPKPYRLV